NRDGMAPTTSSAADIGSSAVGAADLSSTEDAPPPAKTSGDEAALLTQSASLAVGGAASTPTIPPAPPAASTPPSPTIPPRPRTPGPSRPARLRGSLAFGSSTAGALDSCGCGCGNNWTSYGEANVTGNTINLGVPDRPESNLDQPSDVHGASLLLPAAAQYTFTFDVNLSTWTLTTLTRATARATGRCFPSA